MTYKPDRERSAAPAQLARQLIASGHPFSHLSNNLGGTSSPRRIHTASPLAALSASRKPGRSQSRPRSPAPAAGPESPANAGNSHDTRIADASPTCPSSTHTPGRSPYGPTVSAPPTRRPARNPYPSPSAYSLRSTQPNPRSEGGTVPSNPAPALASRAATGDRNPCTGRILPRSTPGSDPSRAYCRPATAVRSPGPAADAGSFPRNRRKIHWTMAPLPHPV